MGTLSPFNSSLFLAIKDSGSDSTKSETVGAHPDVKKYSVIIYRVSFCKAMKCSTFVPKEVFIIIKTGVYILH